MKSQHRILYPVLPVIGFLGIFFLLPLGAMILISFTQRGTYGGIEWSWTLANYEKVADPLYWKIYWRSLLLAIVTTGSCLIVSFPLAYAIARAPSRIQAVLLMLVVIPFWSNFLVRMYAWIFLLRAEGLFNTILMGLGLVKEPMEILYTNNAVLIGLLYGYLPFMVLSLYVAIERIPVSLEEAARDLYASEWEVFFRVIFPLSRAGILAGCILVFVPSFGSFITPYMLGGGQSMMLGTFIQHEFLVVRDWPFGAALSIFLMVLVLFLLGWVRRQRDLWKEL